MTKFKSYWIKALYSIQSCLGTVLYSWFLKRMASLDLSLTFEMLMT